jgi:hypothetical protein
MSFVSDPKTAHWDTLKSGTGTSGFLSPIFVPIHPLFLVFNIKSGSLLTLVSNYSSLICHEVFYKGAKLILAVGLELMKTGVSLTWIGIFDIKPTFSVFLAMTSYCYFRLSLLYN